MSPPLPPLPIDDAVPALRDALAAGSSAVLQAPPGAGKTTRVPLVLLGAPWLAGQRIVMLEPRRLAARAAARQMARSLGQTVGETVGYRVRLDVRVGPRTQVEVVTEGVLTRFLQRDPALEGVGLVLFDEFHERSLHADLGLALVLQSQALLREELRVLVMSATLDGARVAELLGRARGAPPAPVVTSAGRAYPVEVRHRPRRAEQRVEGAVAAAVREAVRDVAGDVLAFLPGAGEIARAEALLRDPPLPDGVRVIPLHGSLPGEAQDAAIAPSPPGARKVVLATAIAETSLTIEGVRAVVDSGLMRVPRFAPQTGMTRLETVRVTRASAEQRRGRAGRVAPGVCYRLWGEHEEHGLLAHGTPEILEADLAPLALDLAVAGVVDPSELCWLDAPPAASFAQARELLAQLGALDAAAGRVTPHGRAMAELALHPRLAHMVLRGHALGHGALAAELAALLSDRDVLRGADGAPAECDVRLRVEALRSGAGAAAARGLVPDREGLRRARLEARAVRDRLRPPPRPAADDVNAAGLLLALAYPDRVARRRAGGAGRLLLRGGRGAVLPDGDPLAAEEFLAVGELDGRGQEARVRLAAPVALADLEAHFADQIAVETAVAWDDAAGLVRATRRERLGALALAESAVRDPDAAAVAAALLDVVRRGWPALLDDEARRVRERLAFAGALEPGRWPDVSDAALLAGLDGWLLPHLVGLRRREELARLDAGALLLGLVDWPARRRLDALAPTHVEVPSGSRLRVDYADPLAPALAVRLQELFGLAETPAVGAGRVPLTLHLLSPAHRPVQVTRDLAGFWRSSYHDVRRELRGRYPRHPWPDDPMSAAPTRRAKPRG